MEVGLTKPAAESAKIVIAEVNDRMPRSLGDSFIHVSRLTRIVPVSYPIVEVPMGTPGELQKQIASHIAELIPDGATMQMGIGEIPDAVLLYLQDKRDLGVHTELFSDGVIELIEAGVITNAAKTIHRGKVDLGLRHRVAAAVRLHGQQPDLRVPPAGLRQRPVRHRPEHQAGGDQFGAGGGPDRPGVRGLDRHHFYSGVGGQLDFIYGASRSPGGVPIIALPATAKDGDDQPHRADAEAGRGRGHHAQPRALRGDRVRRGRSVRQDDPPAGARR